MTASPSDLLDQRAELLRAGVHDAELTRVTDTLAGLVDAEGLHARRITLDEPPEVLERLVREEPVHPFSGPDDVADRLADDRRCFVLELRSAPSRPLNVVFCALWQGLARDLGEVLDPAAPTADPALAHSAIFYSIWNVEPGWAGLPGGRILLEAAIDELRAELPALTTFATLSPIPGFTRWDRGRTAGQGPHGDGPLHRCAEYLTSLRDDGRPLDAVARFHLGNGARLLALTEGSDRSERGLARSGGIMATYRYEPEDRHANRAALARRTSGRGRRGRPAARSAHDGGLSPRGVGTLCEQRLTGWEPTGRCPIASGRPHVATGRPTEEYRRCDTAHCSSSPC
jgi:malonyl-CoA decarboxylase